MTTNNVPTEQERADFESWTGYSEEALSRDAGDGYCIKGVDNEWRAYQAGRAALQSQDQEDAGRYRFLLTNLQQAYDGDTLESDRLCVHCYMASQYKGGRTIRAEITWRDRTDEPIGLSEAIDHARRIEGDGE